MRDIETLLRETDPAAHTPAYSQDERRRLLTQALTAPTPRRSHKWRIAAVAAASALVVGLGLFQPPGTGATAQAQEVLTEAAINAVDEPTEPGQYWKIVNQGETLLIDNAATCLVRFTDTMYVSVDGTEPTWYDRTQRELAQVLHGDGCRVDGPPEAWAGDLGPNDLPASWQSPSMRFFAELPRDPDALLERLQADTEDRGRGKDHAVHVYVADVLRSGIVPADLRSSLFEVLKKLPTVEVTSQRVMDGIDVTVIGAKDRYGYTDELLIDPARGQVVGEIWRHPDEELESVETLHRQLVDDVPLELQERADRCQYEVHDNGSVGCQ